MSTQQLFKAIRTPAINKWVRRVSGWLILAIIAWRVIDVVFIQAPYGPETWMRLAISGIILGGMYALVAIGYTLVYGILFMINFAHGEVMMIGTFGGYFVLEILKHLPAGTEVKNSFINVHPVLTILFAFLAGMAIASMTGYFLEKIAYRPLRTAPRLVPLISAIGASIFFQNLIQLLFSPQIRSYTNPDALARGAGWSIKVGTSSVLITYTGVFSFILSILLMVGLYLLVQYTKLGRSMRAVAQDKKTAALMGIDVDQVISRTFIISGALAGAAGVMWGVHLGQVHFYLGFIPGIKAFTAAVLGGIGNIPGAMVGGLSLGILEALSPAALGIDFQLKDVIAFSILVLVLIFRPSGILGEALSEEKV